MAARLLECMTIRELQDRPELQLITDSQDVQQVKRLVGGRARGYDGFLASTYTGDVTEAWGFKGNVPFLDKLACRVR